MPLFTSGCNSTFGDVQEEQVVFIGEPTSKSLENMDGIELFHSHFQGI